MICLTFLNQFCDIASCYHPIPFNDSKFCYLVNTVLVKTPTKRKVNGGKALTGFDEEKEPEKY